MILEVITSYANNENVEAFKAQDSNEMLSLIHTITEMEPSLESVERELEESGVFYQPNYTEELGQPLYWAFRITTEGAFTQRIQEEAQRKIAALA